MPLPVCQTTIVMPRSAAVVLAIPALFAGVAYSTSFSSQSSAHHLHVAAAAFTTSTSVSSSALRQTSLSVAAADACTNRDRLAFHQQPTLRQRSAFLRRPPCLSASNTNDDNASASGEVMEEDEGYESEQQQIAQQGFYIRKGMFRDLRCVADLMMDAFYDESSIMYHYHRMLELDRVQANFPYDSSKHEYYVACCPEGRVIGFVDIDARPSARRDAPPRPYLSDLAVSTKYRRRGIASKLVERCEAKARAMGKSKMYLRVEAKNDAALGMYCDNMAYERRQHPVFGVKDTTVLLRCDLQERLEMMSNESAGAERRLETTATESDSAIDFQV